MKNLLFTFSLGLIAFSVNAQNLFEQIGAPGTLNILLRNKTLDAKAANISGTPYIDDKFYMADISNVTEKVLIRYNAATDEIEIKKQEGEQEFLLPKKAEYNTIVRNYGQYILKNVLYTTSKGEMINGYLVEIYANDVVSLLRRDKIKVEDSRQGNGYTGFIPAKYVKASPEYYFKMKDQNPVAFPKNKKAIAEMFGSKKSEIDSFFKSNKLSWKSEEDMSKITQFISTLSLLE